MHLYLNGTDPRLHSYGNVISRGYLGQNADTLCVCNIENGNNSSQKLNINISTEDYMLSAFE